METVYEVAERLFPNKMEEYDIFLMGANWQKGQYTIEEQHIERSIGELEKEYIKGFNEGSYWQQERSYSEEEVLDITKQAYAMGRSNYTIEAFNKWFKQFKKI